MMPQQIASYCTSNVKTITQCIICRDVSRPRTWKTLQWLQEQWQYNINECAISQLTDICLKNKVLCWTWREIKQDRCLYSSSSLQLQRECSTCKRNVRGGGRGGGAISLSFPVIKKGILVLSNHTIYEKGLFSNSKSGRAPVTVSLI